MTHAAGLYAPKTPRVGLGRDNVHKDGSLQANSSDVPWAGLCFPNTSIQMTSVSVSLLPCFSSFSRLTAPTLAPATRRPLSFSPASLPAQGHRQRPSGGCPQGHGPSTQSQPEVLSSRPRLSDRPSGPHSISDSGSKFPCPYLTPLQHPSSGPCSEPLLVPDTQPTSLQPPGSNDTAFSKCSHVTSKQCQPRLGTRWQGKMSGPGWGTSSPQFTCLNPGGSYSRPTK